MPMEIRVLENVDALATEAASIIAAEARSAVAARGRFILALSGGSSRAPWQMLRSLTTQDVPWNDLHIVQVDERLAPDGHADRNMTHIRDNLPGQALLSAMRIHSMPVLDPDLAEAAARYAKVLADIAGSPTVIDLVHLGFGPDGHTASLIPGDPVLDVTDTDVAITGPYQGRQRMTLTYPILNRARRILWLAAGSEKAPMLRRLQNADPSIPAGRVRQDNAIILADRPAADLSS
jgi:6-phosphogluconolactonase